MKTLFAIAFTFSSLLFLALARSEPLGQTLLLLYTCTPISFFIGLFGLWYGLCILIKSGRSDEVEGLLTVSNYMLAVGLFGTHAMIYQAALIMRQPDAMLLQTSPLRIALVFYFAGSAFLVLRWLTKERFGEWIWVVSCVGWTIITFFSEGWRLRMLGKLYLNFKDWL